MKKLICIGGGEIPRIKNGKLLPYETKEIDNEIVKLSGKTNPKFCFISTASSHPEDYYNGIKSVYEKLGCHVFHLDTSKPFEELSADILSSDIIYIGGGNTRHMLDEFRRIGLDDLLIKAYDSGIVCAGLSAGSYCWFTCNYDLIMGLNIIHAVNCVHYDAKDSAAKCKFYNVIKEKKLIGYAIENCVAIKFIDNQISVIRSDKNRNAYRIAFEGNRFTEKIL